jgi:hypothetical protein
VQKLGKRLDPPAATVTTAKAELPEKKHSVLRQKSSSAESQQVKGKGKVNQGSSVSRSTRGSSKVQPEVIELSSDEVRSSRAQSSRAKRKSPSKVAKNEGLPDAMDIDMHDFANKPTVLPTRQMPLAKTTNQKSSISSPEPPRSSLSTIIDVLEEERSNLLTAMSSGKGKKHPDVITVSGWQTKVYMRMSITNYQAKSEIFDYYAADFARHLGPQWHSSELYKWAKKNAKSKPKFEHITEEGILKLARRQKNPNAAAKDSKTLSLTESQTPTEAMGRQPHKGRLSGKAAGLRPSLGSKKRLRDLDGDEDDMDVDADGYPLKKTSKTSEYFTDGENEEQANTSTSSSGEGQDDKDDKDKDTPLTRIIIRAEPLPSTQPKGPNHTWTCGEPDCEYVVRGADGQAGQDLILKHFEEHEQEASDEAKEREMSKISLAMQESQGHMPIKYAYFPPYLIEVHYL